jgi:hypothetical protein
MTNRPEPRLQTDIVVRIWGMNSASQAFFQNVEARNISNAGALLCGLDHELTAGDVIGVQLGERKARFRVVWAISTQPMNKGQIGVQLVEGQECPWKDKIAAAAVVPEPPKPAGFNKRKFARQRINFPIEINDRRGGSAHMRTQATDIGGRGCYVETQLPLPFGTALEMTFWIESEKIVTAAVVRACDPGVGMGIEFTGLSEELQQRFQQFLEKQAADAASAGA